MPMEHISFSPMPNTFWLNVLQKQNIAKGTEISEAKSLASSEAVGAGCFWQRQVYKQSRSNFQTFDWRCVNKALRIFTHICSEVILWNTWIS